MAKSLFNQFAQIRGSRTYDDTLSMVLSELSGRAKTAGLTVDVTGGNTITITAGGTFERRDVGNYVVIGGSAYVITAWTSTTVVTVGGSPANTTGASAALHYFQNLEDDLNYIRTQLELIIGENNWYDAPDATLSGIRNELDNLSSSYLGLTDTYIGGLVSGGTYTADNMLYTSTSGVHDTSAMTYNAGTGDIRMGADGGARMIVDADVNSTLYGDDDTYLTISGAGGNIAGVDNSVVVFNFTDTSQVIGPTTDTSLTINQSANTFTFAPNTTSEMVINTSGMTLKSGASVNDIVTTVSEPGDDTHLMTEQALVEYVTTVTGNLTTVHNDLTGLQGGQANEYYHITAYENAAFSSDNTTFTFVQALAGTSLSLSGDVDAVNADFSGNVSAVDGDFTGNMTVTGTLDVDGAVDLDSTLNVEGAATFQNNVTVDETFGFNTGTTVTEIATSVDGSGDDNTLLTEKAIYDLVNTVSGSIEHNELEGLQGGTTDEYYHLTANEEGAFSSNGTTFTFTQALAGTSLSLSGDVDAVNADFSGTLDADGAATLGSTLDVSGNVDFYSNVNVSGTFGFDSGNTVNNIVYSMSEPGSDDNLVTEQGIVEYVDTISGSLQSDVIWEIVDTPYNQIRPKVSHINRPVYLGNNLTIAGDLTVSGTTTTINSEELTVVDKTITVNYGEVGNGITGTPEAGIIVDRGQDSDYYFVFDERYDNFRVGISGSTQAVATRENAPLDQRVTWWDTGNTMLTTSGTTYMIIDPGASNMTASVAGNEWLDVSSTITDIFAPGNATQNYNSYLRLQAGTATIYAGTGSGASTAQLTVDDGGIALASGPDVNEILESTDTLSAASTDDQLATAKLIYDEISTLSGSVGALTYLDLTDTPSSYPGANYFALSNGAGNAMTFASTVAHNTYLDTFDGGTSGEYYHLTSAEYSSFSVATGTWTFSANLALTSGTSVNDIDVAIVSPGDDNSLATTKAIVDFVTGSNIDHDEDLTGLNGGNGTDYWHLNANTYNALSSDGTDLTISDNIIAQGNVTVSGTFGFDAGNTVNDIQTSMGPTGDDNTLLTEKAIYDWVNTVSGSITSNDTFLELEDTFSSYTADNMMYTTTTGISDTSDMTYNASTGDIRMGADGGAKVMVDASESTTIYGDDDTYVTVSGGSTGFVDDGTLRMSITDSGLALQTGERVKDIVAAIAAPGDDTTLATEKAIVDYINTVSGSMEHNELEGLQGGDTDEYYHLNVHEEAQISASVSTAITIGDAADTNMLVDSSNNNIIFEANNTTEFTIDTGGVALATGTAVNEILDSNDDLDTTSTDDQLATAKLIYNEIATLSGSVGALTYLDLTDTPSSYAGAGYIAVINGSNDAMTFTQYLDHNDDLNNQQGGTTDEYYHLTSDEYTQFSAADSTHFSFGAGTALDVGGTFALASGTSVNDIQTSLDPTGDDNTLLTEKAVYDWVNTVSGVLDDAISAQDEFIELTDTPAAYAGNANYLLRVNGTPDAVIFESELMYDGSTFTVSGDQTVTGNVDVQTNLTVTGTLDVDGAVDFDSTLNVQGAATLQNNLTVGGTFGLATGTTVNDIDIALVSPGDDNTLATTKAIVDYVNTISGSIEHNELEGLQGGNGSDEYFHLTSNENAAFSSNGTTFTFTQALAGTSLSLSGDVDAVNADFSGTLDADGATTLGSTLGVVGAADFHNNVNVSGTFGFDGGNTINNIVYSMSEPGSDDNLVSEQGIVEYVDTISGSLQSDVIWEIVDTPYNQIRPKVSHINRPVYLGNNLTIAGDLTVSGTTTTINSEELTVVDKTITVNYGEAGNGITGSPEAGIVVDRGQDADYYFVFDERQDNFRVGISGSTQAVATREDTPLDQRVLWWDASNTMAVTSGTSYIVVDTAADEVNTFVGSTEMLHLEAGNDNLNAVKLATTDGANYLAMNPSTNNVLMYAGSQEILDLTALNQIIGLQAAEYIEVDQTNNDIDFNVANTTEMTIASTGMSLKTGASVNEILASTDALDASSTDDQLATAKLIYDEISTLSGSVGALTYLDLTDTPSSYAGAGYIAVINGSNDAMTFTATLDHNDDLSGQQGGTTDEYYHLTNNEYSAFSSDGSTFTFTQDLAGVNLDLSGTFSFDSGQTVDTIDTSISEPGLDTSLVTEKAVVDWVDAVSGTLNSTISNLDHDEDLNGLNGGNGTDYWHLDANTYNAFSSDGTNLTISDNVIAQGNMTVSGTLGFDAGQTVNEIVTTVTSGSTDNQLPTANAVWDAIDGVNPHTHYDKDMTWGASGSTWTLNDATIDGATPDGLEVYVNGLKNRDHVDYYTVGVVGSVMTVTFAYTTYDSDWVNVTYLTIDA